MKKVVIELIQVKNLIETFVSQNKLTITIGDEIRVTKNKDGGISKNWILRTMFNSEVIKFDDLVKKESKYYAIFETKNGEQFKIQTELNDNYLTGLDYDIVEKFVIGLKKLKEDVEKKTFELHQITSNYRFEI